MFILFFKGFEYVCFGKDFFLCLVSCVVDVYVFNEFDFCVNSLSEFD